MSARLTYRFGPLERRGLLGPVRGGQAAALAAGALSAIAILNSVPTAEGAFLATSAIAIAAATAALPVGGRTIDQWAPVIGSFVARGWLGRRHLRAAAHVQGVRARGLGARRPEIRHPAAALPHSLRDVRISTADYRGRSIGILVSARGRRLTAVLACRAAAFALLDPGSQERRLARWGHLLATSASAPTTRLQWLERTAPSQGDELARWVHAERDPAVPPRGTAMIDSYLELIGTTARVTHEHEVLLALQVDARRIRTRGHDAPLHSLLAEAERLAEALEAAEVSVLGALSGDQIARSLRTSFDPYCRTELAALEAGGGVDIGPSGPWPLGVQESWDHYRTDGALHATYWIAGWPRLDVSPMFMDPLLGHSSAVRTVSVIFEPISPDRSTREAEAAVTRDRADQELRRRFGQSQTARQRQAEEAAARREAELAAGHAEVRLAGFVTVSGRDEDELRRSCSEVTEQAARARLELRRLYGQQAASFTFTLPLCRGLA